MVPVAIDDGAPTPVVQPALLALRVAVASNTQSGHSGHALVVLGADARKGQSHAQRIWLGMASTTQMRRTLGLANLTVAFASPDVSGAYVRVNSTSVRLVGLLPVEPRFMLSSTACERKRPGAGLGSPVP
jgi:hypothetical protein